MTWSVSGEMVNRLLRQNCWCKCVDRWTKKTMMEGTPKVKVILDMDDREMESEDLKIGLANKVILVDMDDREMGCAEKMYAHEKGLLHRAFSVFLFRDDCVLLQKRAQGKYHCGGLWTNTCCSHPGPGEPVREAAVRRLREELAIAVEAEDLREVHGFVYHRPFANGLTEFEYDHILVGEYNGIWELNPEEVEEIRWVQIEEMKKDIAQHPGKYTPWFITALKEAEAGR
ncbi:MAG: isopentenyl-diphosphate Delta-isomerase [Clostridiales bacterium]|nr:isopentenyl-diphosphate Delta-isomerase [Clostridiales bacterium]